MPPSYHFSKPQSSNESLSNAQELDRHARQHKVKEHLQLMLELAENHKSDWEAVASSKDNGCSGTLAQVRFRGWGRGLSLNWVVLT